MSPFNFQAMLQTLGGNPYGQQEDDGSAGIAALIQHLRGGGSFPVGAVNQAANVPQGNPLDPNMSPSTAQVQTPTPQAAPPTQDPNTIQVNGQGAAPPAPEDDTPPPPPSMGNRDYLQEAQQAAANAPQRHGMFGTKGTLRDVLGTLGDAFLLQSGNKPIYAPQRMLEKQADAMTGFTANPQAAMERLSQAGFGNEAQEMYKNYAANQIAQLRAGIAARQNADAREKQYGARFSAFMGAATPQNWDKTKAILQTLKDRGQLGDSYQIPDKFDPDLAALHQRGGIDSVQQIRTDLSNARLNAMEDYHNRSLDIRQQAVDKMPGARPAPNPTNASIAAPILKKVQNGQQLTPGEQDVLNRTAPGRKGSALERMMSGGGAGGSASVGKPPAGFTVTRH